MLTKGAKEGRRGACCVGTMRSLPSFLFFLLMSGTPGGALLASPLTMYTDAGTDQIMKGRLDVTAHWDSNEYIPYQTPPRALATSNT